MWFCSVNRRTLLTASALVLVMLLALAPGSQAVERLRVTVGDTTAMPGQKNSVITVFMTNTLDRVAAFTLHLALARTDIANFQTEYDTVIDTTYWDCLATSGGKCVDSVSVDFPDLNPWDMRYISSTPVTVGSFDTVGTLISGWEMVEARSVSTGERGLDIKLTAIADRASTPGTKPPIYPQQGGVLFRLLADAFDIPPEQTDRTVSIMIDYSWKPYFVFSTPSGAAIGWTNVLKPDTNFYECTSHEPPPGNGCYEWTKMKESQCEDGCDSVRIDTISVPVLDTIAVKLYNGSLEVLQYRCGDVNKSGTLTIGDVSMLIDHLFISGVPIDPLTLGNVNCSDEDPMRLTIGDVSALIDRLFISLTPLCCE
jgi:hypothetical protein